jgi:hypothetical protein
MVATSSYKDILKKTNYPKKTLITFPLSSSFLFLLSLKNNENIFYYSSINQHKSSLVASAPCVNFKVNSHQATLLVMP